MTHYVPSTYMYKKHCNFMNIFITCTFADIYISNKKSLLSIFLIVISEIWTLRGSQGMQLSAGMHFSASHLFSHAQFMWQTDRCGRGEIDMGPLQGISDGRNSDVVLFSAYQLTFCSPPSWHSSWWPLVCVAGISDSLMPTATHLAAESLTIIKRNVARSFHLTPLYPFLQIPQ